MDHNAVIAVITALVFGRGQVLACRQVPEPVHAVPLAYPAVRRFRVLRLVDLNFPQCLPRDKYNQLDYNVTSWINCTFFSPLSLFDSCFWPFT